MSTVAIAVPEVNRVPERVHHKFAVRRHIKIIAVVCECGAVTHGPGVRKWKKCPRCGEPVITDKERRFRETHPFLDVDQEIYERAVQR